MNMNKSFAFVLSAAACVFSIFASSCGRKSSSKTANQSENIPKMVDGGKITLGFATELNNFDPFSSMTADARSINFNIFEGLVKVSPDGSFEPAIAERYSVSPDARVWTFIIRKGVKFHDGKLLSKDDVSYSIQKAIDRNMAGYAKIESFGFDSQGETLTVSLSSPDAGFIAYLSTPIVEKDASNLAIHPVGTGPFSFKEYVEQDHITLVRNKDYWGKKANLDTVVVKFAASQADLVLNFQAGSIDGFSANADAVEQLNRDEINLYPRNSNSVQLLALNNEFGPFKDKNIRKALCYLVDPESIIRIVNYGYGVKNCSPLISSLSKYYASDVDFNYKRDVEKAKSLIASSSYPDGFSFTITVPSSYTVHVKTAEVIINELEEAGIKAQIKQVDWATWLQNAYSNRDYEATIISLDGSLAYPTAFLSRYCSDAHNNFVNFKNDEYDRFYKRAVSTTNESEKVEYFKQCQKILSEEAASVYLEDISMLTVYNKHFQGCKDYPLYAIDLSAIYAVEAVQN